MAEGFQKLESTIVYVDIGQTYMTLPGSKSMACNESNQVNVGGPDSSSINVRHMEVSADKSNQRGGRDVC